MGTQCNPRPQIVMREGAIAQSAFGSWRVGCGRSACHVTSCDRSQGGSLRSSSPPIPRICVLETPHGETWQCSPDRTTCARIPYTVYDVRPSHKECEGRQSNQRRRVRVGTEVSANFGPGCGIAGRPISCRGEVSARSRGQPLHHILLPP